MSLAPVDLMEGNHHRRRKSGDFSGVGGLGTSIGLRERTKVAPKEISDGNGGMGCISGAQRKTKTKVVKLNNLCMYGAKRGNNSYILNPPRQGNKCVRRK